MADLKLPEGQKPKRPIGAPFAVITNLFRRNPQPSPDGRSEPDADLLEQGWRACCRDERGEWLYAPPSRYSRWGDW